MRAWWPGPRAPQLSTGGLPFTRALPPPPEGVGRALGGCLRCLASCSRTQKSNVKGPEPASPGSHEACKAIYLTSPCRVPPPFPCLHKNFKGDFVALL